MILVGILAGCSPRSYVMNDLHETFQAQSLVDAEAHKAADEPKIDPKIETSIDFTPAKDSSAQTAVQDQNPDDQPVQTALVPLSHTFAGNETEHIKFSRYDPFGANSSFVIQLDELYYCYPIDGKFSSGYGKRGRSTHTGVDLVAAAGTPIYAIFDGVVRLAKPYYGYGNVIVVRHDNGLETVYAHNSKNLVRVGQKVACGEQIALCGRTGTASTNHLHFEVRVQGITINPTLLIDVQAKTLASGELRVSRSGSGSISAQRTKSGELLATSGRNSTTPTTEPKANVTADQGSAHNDEQDNEQILIPTEQPKANVSRGVRVDGKVYPASNASTTQSGTKSSSPTYHTIARGDTMSGIARKYGTTVSKICALNNMTTQQADKISAGKKLRVK